MGARTNSKDVESSLRNKLSSLSNPPANRCIYKVPEHIRKVSRECYEPSIFSIGPIYYKIPSLESSFELKLEHLKGFLECAYNIGNRGNSLGDYIDKMKEWEEEARSYYEEKISLTSNEFIEMMMVDAAFIIYFFMCWKPSQFQITKIPITEKYPWMGKLEQDLFLLDNQLPFFVLNNLYHMAFGSAHPTFKDLTFDFIASTALPGHETASRRPEVKTHEIKHVVDFLRVCCLPSKLGHQKCKKVQYNSPPRAILPPSAKKLWEAGVKFKASHIGNNLLDIEFSDGVLRIPRLKVSDTTEGILRNIIFFEQCRRTNGSSCFADYAFFLDALINTCEDVQILVERGIIENLLGSDAEVATMVNRLCKYVVIESDLTYYSDISQKLNAHANTRMNKWISVLRRDYFNHPWSIISVVYLVILLLLTVLQVYTGFKN